jgi:pimeloyl-ACP methyl ester carboxylesterase
MTKRLFLVLLVIWSAKALAERDVKALAERSPEGFALQGQHAECSHLTMLRFPDVRVTEATAVPAATSGPIRAAHCRVNGVIGTEIKFQLLLPDEWNHKFIMGGGGGFVGTVDNQARPSVNAGYATVGTDTGHQGGATDATWALDNVERQLNFGYLGVHRTAEVAKAILRSYYGSNETRAYFAGCSNGGREAMMEAQRYPDDFEGIVAGAPAMDFVGIAAQFIKDIQVAFPDSKSLAPAFTPAVLKSVEAQILDKCDALDGVKDGVMEDPRRCTVDVATLTGLTDAQRTALKKIYAETASKGASIYAAQPFGGEGEGGGWPSWITGGGLATPQGPSLRFAFGTQFFKYFIFSDPNWEYIHYDIANTRRDARLVGKLLNATDPNLDAFKAKGHKLILWHGWSDPALTALASVNYYEQVVARDAAASDYFRMFMMPGVLHCAGGPGPDNVDWTATIDTWVDGHRAPERLVARKVVNGEATRSRPLCPYPQHAVYSGSGSTDDERNFACK